jgi:DNA-binding HxlR family transcriptional regulator
MTGNRAVIPRPPPRPCPLEKYLAVVSGPWVARILWYLLDGPRRFAELQRDLDGVSAKVLAAKLRALEREGIVKRTVYPTTPPQVEYSVTQRGRAFEPVFRAMEQAARELFGPPANPTPADATVEEEPLAAAPGRAD